MLASDAEDPGKIASDTFWHTVFPDHPYGRDPTGTPESLKRIAAADLKAFVGQQFARDRLKIGVVGDITPADLGPALDKLFGALPASGATRDAAAPPCPRAPAAPCWSIATCRRAWSCSARTASSATIPISTRPRC